MSNVMPTPIIDKNGKRTTVHKKVDDTSTSSRVASIGAPALTLPRDSKETPIPAFVGGTVELARYDFETSEIYEDSQVDEESGDLVYVYNDEYDDVDQRAPYLAGEDGIAAVATKEESSNGTNYTVRLSKFDGNSGQHRSIDVPFFTGSGWNHAPSVGDVVASLADEAYRVEQFPLTAEGIREFADEFGYDPDDDPYYEDENGEEVYDPMKSTRELLTAMHEGAAKFKDLVGEVRYGDYVYGRYKADYGYNSGITYAKDE